jgi:peptide/nickel transport system ATP-binding protein
VLVMNQGRIVEEGPSEVLLSNPRDPYTRALIEAVPQLQAAPPRPMLQAGGA